jgi:hypothetical protein
MFDRASCAEQEMARVEAKVSVVRAVFLVGLLAVASVLGRSAAMITPAVAQVASAEDGYIAARDAAIARFVPDKVPTVAAGAGRGGAPAR